MECHNISNPYVNTYPLQLLHTPLSRVQTKFLGPMETHGGIKNCDTLPLKRPSCTRIDAMITISVAVTIVIYLCVSVIRVSRWGRDEYDADEGV